MPQCLSSRIEHWCFVHTHFRSFRLLLDQVCTWATQSLRIRSFSWCSRRRPKFVCPQWKVIYPALMTWKYRSCAVIACLLWHVNVKWTILELVCNNTMLFKFLHEHRHKKRVRAILLFFYVSNLSPGKGYAVVCSMTMGFWTSHWSTLFRRIIVFWSSNLYVTPGTKKEWVITNFASYLQIAQFQCRVIVSSTYRGNIVSVDPSANLAAFLPLVWTLLCQCGSLGFVHPGISPISE